MVFKGVTQEYLRLEAIDAANCFLLKEKIEGALTLVWFEDDCVLNVDGKDQLFFKSQLVFLTEFHQVVPKVISSVRMIRFNRPFYCILDHDSDVGCKGVLFFGASQLPIIELKNDDLMKFETLWDMFNLEMKSTDDLQLEMLQMMLKRLLILSTRLYKEQRTTNSLEYSSLDLIRSFNYLVETHFKELKTVAEYANELNKSPKTIANYFSKFADKTPLQFIQERIMLEARRLICFSDKPIKEVAYELGYEDIQSFSRFFKKNEGVAPTEYRENYSLGKIATS
jgi:AraC-like DNA-binding protein